ncbi:MAG: hypothetical protein V3R94_07870 [Acidobacteriota bacterium]
MLRRVVFFLWCLLGASPLGAQTSSQLTTSELNDALNALKIQFEQMRSSYEMRIAALEQKLIQFSAAEPPATSSPESLDTSFTEGARTLQALNPEISVTGDVTARFSDTSGNPEFNRLNFDSFEMAIQHPLDPYSSAKFFIAFEEGEFDLEEGYLTWDVLPGNLGLKVGRFHTNFGKMNIYHKHALPWANRDLPTQTLFGDEGLISEGFSLSWLPPPLPIADTSEVYFEVVNNSNDLAFSGKGFGDPLYLGRLLNFYDLTEGTYLEWGISAATSHWDLLEKKRSTVIGADLSYRWEPLRKPYRSLELRSEFFYNQREDWPGGNPFGMYAYGEYRLTRRWYTGLRYQSSDSLENTDQTQWALSPYLTFWQSEWVRLRTQWDFLVFNSNQDQNEHRFFVQFTWSVGPHKHESY